MRGSSVKNFRKRLLIKLLPVVRAAAHIRDWSELARRATEELLRAVSGRQGLPIKAASVFRARAGIAATPP